LPDDLKTYQLRTVRIHLKNDLRRVAVIQASPQVPFSLVCGHVRFGVDMWDFGVDMYTYLLNVQKMA